MRKFLVYLSLAIVVVAMLFFGYRGFVSESQIAQHDRVAKAACRRNLQTIYVACCAYADAHGMSPPSLFALIEQGFLALPAAEHGASNPVMCPAVAGEVSNIPTSVEQWLADVKANRNLSYRLIATPDGKFDKRARTLVLEEYARDHLNGHHALYTDGSIEFVPE